MIKRHYVLLLFIFMIIFQSCENNQKTGMTYMDLNDFCNYEISAKTSDEANSIYYFCLKHGDTVVFNVNVSRNDFKHYNIGDTIFCENNQKIDSTSSCFRIERVGNHQYLIYEKPFINPTRYTNYSVAICHYEDCDYCKQINEQVKH